MMVKELISLGPEALSSCLLSNKEVFYIIFIGILQIQFCLLICELSKSTEYAIQN